MKKEIFTLREVERDIINSLKNAPDTPKLSYKKWSIVSGILGVILAILSIIWPSIAMIGLLIVLVATVIGVSFELLRLRYRINSVNINDYEIETAVLSHKEEEHYKQSGGGAKFRHSRQINNYALYFENGKSLRVPKDNYSWSKERPMSDFALYQNSHRGDKFILVIKKDSGEVALAYYADFFEYKK